MIEPIQASVRSVAVEPLRVSIVEKLEELRRIKDALVDNKVVDPVGALRRTIDLLGPASPASLQRDLHAFGAACALPEETQYDELVESLGVAWMTSEEWMRIHMVALRWGARAVCSQGVAHDAWELLLHAIDNHAWHVAHDLAEYGMPLAVGNAAGFKQMMASLVGAEAARGRLSARYEWRETFRCGDGLIGLLVLTFCANPRYGEVFKSMQEDAAFRARIDALACREIFQPYEPELTRNAFPLMLSVASETTALAIIKKWSAMGRSMAPDWSDALVDFRARCKAREEKTALLAVFDEVSPAATELPAHPVGSSRKSNESPSRRL